MLVPKGEVVLPGVMTSVLLNGKLLLDGHVTEPTIEEGDCSLPRIIVPNYQRKLGLPLNKGAEK